MIASDGMVSRFVESTRDWIRKQQIGFRLKKLGQWLAEGNSLWITLLGLGSALGVGWVVGRFGAAEKTLADQLRIGGWWLQVLGVSMVAIGLKQTRDLFDVPSVKEQALNWLKRFPKVFARREIIKGTISIEGAPGKMKAYGTVEPKPDASIEERLNALEEKYKQLNQKLIAARNEIEVEAQRLDENLEEERRTRDEADAAIREQLESFSVGGLHLESVGLIWLLVGITLGTLSGEVVDLLRLL